MYTTFRRRLVLAILASGVLACGACSNGGDDDSEQTRAQVVTNRICALVPARDAAAGVFPPSPPVSAFGTDLGWTYERDGVIHILFGDTWQRIDICPLQLNDDSLGTLAMPADDWPGFDARDSIAQEDCPELTFAVDDAGTAFAPIELRRWDGEVVPLGPLNTPDTAFFDGNREWAIFIVGGGQSCDVTQGTCPQTYSPQAADLQCDTVGSEALCVDNTGTRSGDARQAFYLHVAERVATTRYVSRAMFLTNKYLNLTARTVRAFEPDGGHYDYRPGTSALLAWGRPGFEDQGRQGECPPYFFYLPLPFQVEGEQIAFAPRYFSGYDGGGKPLYSGSQPDAVPLYTGEFEPVNHAAVSYVEPLSRWMTIYGGSVVDYANPDGIAGESQPVPGAFYARFAVDPWGPWTDAQVVMPEEVVAEDMACGMRAPVGCTANPADPPVRPACISTFDGDSGGALYGANVIDAFTREVSAQSTRGPAADVFWNLSTWNPYSVVLVKTHIELE